MLIVGFYHDLWSVVGRLSKKQAEGFERLFLLLEVENIHFRFSLNFEDVSLQLTHYSSITAFCQLQHNVVLMAISVDMVRKEGWVPDNVYVYSLHMVHANHSNTIAEKKFPNKCRETLV